MENTVGNENKILCRKCGGPHFTIKCGKEKKLEEKKVEIDTKPQYIESKSNSENFHRNKDHSDRENFQRGENKKYFKKTYRVKLSELPIDMTEEEMKILITDWGHIVRVKIIVYPENATAYIDFGYEDEAEYFIEAIDKTCLEYKIISACRVSSN